jgi:hypothetical protein
VYAEAQLQKVRFEWPLVLIVGISDKCLLACLKNEGAEITSKKPTFGYLSDLGECIGDLPTRGENGCCPRRMAGSNRVSGE